MRHNLLGKCFDIRSRAGHAGRPDKAINTELNQGLKTRYRLLRCPGDRDCVQNTVGQQILVSSLVTGVLGVIILGFHHGQFFVELVIKVIPGHRRKNGAGCDRCVTFNLFTRSIAIV